MINWIKCSDRMPEMDKQVLFLADKIYPYFGIYSEIYEGSNRFWRSNQDARFSESQVTHWSEFNLPTRDIND